MKIDIEKTVYVFGAGASKCFFDFPCMNDFFLNYDPDKYPNLSKFIECYFLFTKDHGGHSWNKKKKESLNLEEIITALELATDNVGSFGNPPTFQLQQAKKEFDEFVKKTLQIDRNLPENEKKFEKLYKSTQLLFEDPANNRNQDSFITLNYDLILDLLLFECAEKNDLHHLKSEAMLRRMYELLGRVGVVAGDRPSLPWKSRDAGHYLKLHGSLDWLYCPNERCGNHQQFFANWLGADKIHDSEGSFCILCGTPLVSVIIPPTLNKSFQKFPKLGLLWNLACSELSKAQKIVIFGLSFAPSDYYLKWLFKSAIISNSSDMPAKIVIINKDPKVKETTENLLGMETTIFTEFDEYMQELKR